MGLRAVPPRREAAAPAHAPDLGDVRGQAFAKRALTVAAALTAALVLATQTPRADQTAPQGAGAPQRPGGGIMRRPGESTMYGP